MGIPKLNRWLVDRCPKAIRKQSLLEYQDKPVAVDISIYLYRFLMDGRFHENLYLFFAIFKYYCIQPIFIFDGKAPVEKKATMQKRKKDKQDATTEYAELETLLAETTEDHIRKEILSKMAALKKRMVKITWTHIDDAIELLTAFGFEYYLAPHEADQLCVHLAVTNQVYAIVSDDMDLLISGAKRVLRSLNMYTHEITLYDTTAILSDIQMTLNDFRETVVLAGTDYESKPGLPIRKCFDLFSEYKGSQTKNKITFAEWLHEKNIVVLSEFQHICSLFDTHYVSEELEEFIQKKRQQKPKLSIPDIKRIMIKHKFVFV